MINYNQKYQTICLAIILTSVLLLNSCSSQTGSPDENSQKAAPTNTIMSEPSTQPRSIETESTPTISPSPTLEATATSESSKPEPTTEFLPDPDSAPTFSLSRTSRDLPENIVEEMMFFGAMGGGSDPCEEAPDGTLSVPDSDSPIYMFGAAFEKKCINICGWDQAESVLITMNKPDNDVISDTVDTNFYGLAVFCPEFLVDDPLGEYFLLAEGDSGDIETTFNVVIPKEPTLTIRDEELILYAFYPNEKVQILAYRRDDRGDSQMFVGRQEFQVDEDGKLAIELEEELLAYYAIGETSGEAKYHYFGHGSATCAEAPPSLLNVGMQAQVTNKNGATVYPEGSLIWGTVVEITSGPGCVDGMDYSWHVTAPNGVSGSVVEYNLSKEVDPSIIPSELTCDGAMPTRFNIGMHGRTTFSSDSPLRLYADAGYSKKIRRELPAGTEFDLTHGPSCADKTIWWKVMTKDGSAGWTPEGMDGEYFIQPWN